MAGRKGGAWKKHYLGSPSYEIDKAPLLNMKKTGSERLSNLAKIPLSPGFHTQVCLTVRHRAPAAPAFLVRRPHHVL